MWRACLDEGAIAVSLHLQPSFTGPRHSIQDFFSISCSIRVGFRVCPPQPGRWEWPRPANYRHAVNKTLTRTEPAATKPRPTRVVACGARDAVATAFVTPLRGCAPRSA